MDTVKKIWENPLTGLISKQNLYKKAKNEDNNVTMKIVKEFLDKKYSSQIHKKIVKPHFYYPITADKENEIIQIELIDMTNISTKNKNYILLLVCFDVFTRIAYVFPMKNKAISVTNAFSKLLKKSIQRE